MITSKKLTAERIAEIEKVPITYDEDSPKFTKEELQEFVPYHKEYFDITPKKVLISFKIDADILAIMKATGKGYQTRMNKYLLEAVIEDRFKPNTYKTDKNFSTKVAFLGFTPPQLLRQFCLRQKRFCGLSACYGGQAHWPAYC